jgi:hypothetical protein
MTKEGDAHTVKTNKTWNESLISVLVFIQTKKKRKQKKDKKN